MKNFVIIGLCLGLIGCTSTSSLMLKPSTGPQYGMTREQLIDLLGKPDAIEIYKKSDMTRVEYYIYVREYQSSEDKMPICLINNRVVGWGKSYYEDHVSQDDIRIK